MCRSKTEYLIIAFYLTYKKIFEFFRHIFRQTIREFIFFNKNISYINIRILN